MTQTGGRLAPIAVVLTIAMFSQLVACGGKRAVNDKLGPPPTVITVVHPHIQPLELVETSVGTLRTAQNQHIATEVPGTVLRILVRPGDTVKMGQLVAVIDPTDLVLKSTADRAEVERIEALLVSPESSLKQGIADEPNDAAAKKAGGENAIQHDTLKEQLAAAQARATQSASDVSKAQIIALLNGVIEERLVAIGDTLKVGDPVFRLVSNSELHAHFTLPEAAAQTLKRGQTLQMSSPQLPDKPIDGVIEDIRPISTETNRSTDVIVRLNASGNGLKSGASLNTSVNVGKRDRALVVPEQSVIKRPAGMVVYVINNGIAEQRIVKTGGKRPGLIEIVSGLTADDTVAVDGATFLNNGTVVSVQDKSRWRAPEGSDDANDIHRVKKIITPIKGGAHKP